MLLVNAAGYWGVISAFAPLLPAAQITTAFDASMASLSDCEYPVPLQEFEITEAPLRLAYSIAEIASEMYPDPFSFRNLSGMIFTFHAVPATPIPLLPTAAMVPAQCVP
ncbi:MAG: hypothetical protein BWY05_01071 [Euryarchaeota archaeon ADurb.Bin165]|nr:MAG: hypothetical protein BWY05_01071 [Euryarchaeota archaeon ADurb.Bin165]